MNTKETKETETVDNKQLIPVALIDVSPLPAQALRRAGFTEEADASLKASIEAVGGLIQPIVVRKVGARYELVCGERRLRSVQSLGWYAIEAIVRDLTDDEAAHQQLQENLQRENLNPMEEATAFGLYAEKHSIAEIVAQFGRSETYVRRRMKLRELDETLVPKVASGLIPVAYAEVIAPLTKAAQTQAVKKFLFQYDNETVKSLKDFKSSVERAFNVRLDTACFSRESDSLGEVACVNCPKRSGFEPSLFGETDLEKEDTCLDAKCFKGKTLKHMWAMVETLKIGLPEDEKPIVVECGWNYGDSIARQFKKACRVVTDFKRDPVPVGACADVRPALVLKDSYGTKPEKALQGTIQHFCFGDECETHDNPKAQVSQYDDPRYKAQREDASLVSEARRAIFPTVLDQFDEYLAAENRLMYQPFGSEIFLEDAFLNYFPSRYQVSRSMLSAIVQKYGFDPERSWEDHAQWWNATLDEESRHRLAFLATATDSLEALVIGRNNNYPTGAISKMLVDAEINWIALVAQHIVDTVPDEYKAKAEEYLKQAQDGADGIHFRFALTDEMAAEIAAEEAEEEAEEARLAALEDEEEDAEEDEETEEVEETEEADEAIRG